MNRKIIAIVIIVVGIALLILGLNELDTFGSRAGRLMGARLSNEVLFYFVAGGICTVYGLLKVMKK